MDFKDPTRILDNEVKSFHETVVNPDESLDETNKVKCTLAFTFGAVTMWNIMNELLEMSSTPGKELDSLIIGAGLTNEIMHVKKIVTDKINSIKKG
jgi:hypothetical protein